MITVGNLVLKIPHPVGKVVGAVLIIAGSALKVYVSAEGAEPVEVHISLTRDQLREVQEAIAMGDKNITVTQVDGQKDVFQLADGGTVPHWRPTTQPAITAPRELR